MLNGPFWQRDSGKSRCASLQAWFAISLLLMKNQFKPVPREERGGGKSRAAGFATSCTLWILAHRYGLTGSSLITDVLIRGAWLVFSQLSYRASVLQFSL